MKPVTVRVGTYGAVTENQQQGLDHIVEYLTKAIQPGIMIPSTARIVIEWGDEFLLAEMRED